MRKIHLSTVLRTAAYRYLQPPGGKEGSERFSCLAAWEAGYYLGGGGEAGDWAESYANEALEDCNLSTYPEDVFPPQEGWYEDAQQSVRFMWLLFLAEEARGKKLYIEVEES